MRTIFTIIIFAIITAGSTLSATAQTTAFVYQRNLREPGFAANVAHQFQFNNTMRAELDELGSILCAMSKSGLMCSGGVEK